VRPVFSTSPASDPFYGGRARTDHQGVLAQFPGPFLLGSSVTRGDPQPSSLFRRNPLLISAGVAKRF
jgi:hypothetical protein